MNHCPAALDMHEQRVQEIDRRGFETGISCHAVLEAVGRETERRGRELELPEIEAVGDSVADALITEGREFDGHPEPPLHPDAVFRGRELAEEWLSVHPIQTCGARYEVGLAVDVDWKPCAYDSDDAWIAAILDKVVVEDELDEEGETKVLIVRDYKTAWSADASELETLQRKIQAVLAAKCLAEAKNADVIRLEVAAIRTWRIFTEELYLRHGAKQKLRRWQRDIGTVVKEYGAMLIAGDGARPARPGAGCTGCPYLHRCSDAQLYFDATGLPDDPKERARAYMVASAMLDSLKPMVQEDAGYTWIELEDGSRLGWQGKPSQRMKDDAHQTLAELWCENAGKKELSPFVSSAYAALKNISLSDARAVLKEVFPGRENAIYRRAYEDAVTEPYKRRNWTIWKREDDE